MTADFNFSITAGAGGTNPASGVDNFSVAFATARPNSTYYVTASTATVTAIYGIDIVSQTTTGFTVQLTAPLAASDVIEFHVYDPANSTVAPGNGLIKTTVISGATTSFTTTADTNKIRVRMVGGGGAGGGGTAVASSVAACGGGGGGGYAEATIAVAPSTAYACSVGSAGGAHGGNTTLTIGATTFTAHGGSAPTGVTPTNYSTVFPGGEGGAVGSGADINAGGQQGYSGMTIASHIQVTGAGGSGPFGGGGALVGSTSGTTTNGNAGTGFGSGGSGAVIGSTSGTGGAGTGGAIVIDEYV